MPDSRILLGVIGRPHGVRGLVRVHAYAADPASLEAYGTLRDDQGREWRLRWRGDGIAELRGPDGKSLPDRTAAERLVNQRLWTTRDQLPEPDEDEFYLADLIGLDARDAAGQVLGRVIQVHDYGAGASLEIERDGAPPLLIPFTRAAVPAVDVAGGTVTIIPPDILEARTPEDSRGEQADREDGADGPDNREAPSTRDSQLPPLPLAGEGLVESAAFNRGEGTAP